MRQSVAHAARRAAAAALQGAVRVGAGRTHALQAQRGAAAAGFAPALHRCAAAPPAWRGFAAAAAEGEGEGEAMDRAKAIAAALGGKASSSAGFSEAEKREPSARVLALADQIEELNLIEVADLTKLIKERLGLPDAPAMPAGMMMPMMAGAPGAAAGGAGGEAEAPKVEEKTAFDVKLEKFDAATKIKLIKEVRPAFGLLSQTTHLLTHLLTHNSFLSRLLVRRCAGSNRTWA